MSKIFHAALELYAEHPEILTLQAVLFVLLLIGVRFCIRIVNRLIDAKDQEIERLADENKQYKLIYFRKNLNLTDDEIKEICPNDIE